jgi:hypothetical protein
MYGFLRGLSTGVFLRGCAWMSVPDNNTENHEVVLRELGWLPGNKLARFSVAKTLEPAPVNLENVTQKLHSIKTPPGKTQSRRVSQCFQKYLKYRNSFTCISGIKLASGKKLARLSGAETLEPAPWNLENVTQKLHSLNSRALAPKSRPLKNLLIYFPEASLIPATQLHDFLCCCWEPTSMHNCINKTPVDRSLRKPYITCARVKKF